MGLIAFYLIKYSVVPIQFLDVLECSFAAGAFPCHARANCIETFGSYLCRCMDGYTGNGLLCTGNYL